MVPDFFVKLRAHIFYPTPVDQVLIAQKKNPEFDFEEWLAQTKTREQDDAERLKKEAEER